jgi:excisionase family DNA binding protein
MTSKILYEISLLEEKIDRLIILMVISNKEVLTLDEVCEYTGLSHSTIYKLTADRKIRFYKPQGKIIYIKKEDLIDWLLRNPSFQNNK